MSRHLSLYRRILLVYPAAFRDSYRDEMVRLFEDLLADAKRPEERLGVLRLWIFTVVDLLNSATRQRMEDAMNNHPALTRLLLVAVPVATVAGLWTIGPPLALFALALGIALLAGRWRSLGPALFGPRRWWVAPILGLALMAMGVGIIALPIGSESVRWALASFIGLIGMVTAIGSALLALVVHLLPSQAE